MIWIIIVLCALGLVNVASAQESPNCSEELAAIKLQLAIANRAEALKEQAFMQASQQLRQEVTGEWAKANTRAEQATKQAAAEKQRADDLAKQVAASQPAPANAAHDAK